LAVKSIVEVPVFVIVGAAERLVAVVAVVALPALVAYGTVKASLVLPPAVTVILEVSLTARDGLLAKLVAVVADVTVALTGVVLVILNLVPSQVIAPPVVFAVCP